MKNRMTTGILFFLFLLTASGVFAAMVENSRQGLPAISVTSHPAFSLESSEQRQGLSRVLLELVSGGAFTSKDPIGFNGGMNLYRYADNNPVLFVDPWGLYCYGGTVEFSGVAPGRPIGGTMYGKTLDFHAINDLTTSLSGSICSFKNIEFLFRQEVYYPAVGDTLEDKGFILPFTTSFSANKVFVYTVRRHELVHAVSNINIAEVLYPKFESQLLKETTCVNNQQECDSWAKELAESKIREVRKMMSKASVRWHEIVVYGTGIKSYSPGHAAEYFDWFYSWLSSL